MSSSPIPAHVPPELVRTYPFGHGKSTTRNVFDIIDELHDGPAAIYAKELYRERAGWVFRKAADIRDILMDSEHFSSEDVAAFAKLTGNWTNVPLGIDPPRHAFYRALLNPLFTPSRMAALDDDIRSHAQSYIAKFHDRGHCDFVREFALEFPIRVFLGMMGLPLELTQQFLQWEKGLIQAATLEELKVSTQAVVDYLKEAIEDRRLHPREDLIGDGIVAEVRGRRMTQDELIGYCFNIYLGGLDTVASHLGHFLRYLAENPEQQALLRARPELIPNAVDELMRALSCVTVGRNCVKEREICGVTVKPGDRVAISMMLAGRDPEEYPNPREVDFSRKPRSISFGHGPHICLGIHLAKRELRVALEEFLKVVPPFRIPDGSVLQTDCAVVVQLRSLPLEWDV
jgi:cytochrome P450